jgi:hypothetical protein
MSEAQQDNQGQGIAASAQSERALVTTTPEADCIVFASRFIVALKGVTVADQLSIEVSDRFGARREFRLETSHQVELSDGSIVRCLVLPLVDLVPVSLHAGKVSIKLLSTGTYIFAGVVEVRRLDVAQGIDPILVRILTTLTHAGAIDKRISMIFNRSTRWIEYGATSEYALDAVFQTPFGVLLEGWIENVSTRDLVIMSGDLTAMAPVEDFLRFPRADVSSTLRATPEGRSAGQMHGFMTSLVGCGEKNRSIYILEWLSEGGLVVGPIAYDALYDRDEALAQALKRLNSDPAIDGERARSILKPLVAAPNPPIRGDFIQFGPEAASPRLSIIVPMSGEQVFLRSLIAQQDNFPDNVEWLFCLQASEGSQQAIKFLSNSQSELSQQVTLIDIEVNVSQAQLFNRAVPHTRGQFLLFLDETSWVEDGRAIVRALKDLENGSLDVLGLAMRLEDGTTDNLGFSLKPDRYHRNLVTVEAVGRGLPAPSKERRGLVQGEIHAVSAGSMLVGRRVFEQLHGFDEELATPDYFDVDFCLRLTASGGRVGMSRIGGLSRGLKPVDLSSSSDLAREALDLLDRCYLAQRHSIALFSRAQLSLRLESSR